MEGDTNITIIRTHGQDDDFQKLIVDLTAYLKIVDGEEHEFYQQYNGSEDIKYVVVVYLQNIPVGCGAIKKYNSSTMEIKRMFVASNQRGRGIASMVLRELELWAVELGFERCILETGKRQIEAVGMYTKNKYAAISNFGPYKGVDNSVCFEKILT